MTATPDLFAWIVVLLLTLEVLRRLPAAIRSPKGRTLWFVFLALDISMATRIQVIGDALYHLTGWDDIATLTKHLVGIAAVAGLLRWVTTVVPGRLDGKPEPGYRRAISSRPRRIVTWAAVIVVTAIFPLARRRSGNAEDADFIFVQAGHLWGSLHLLLFYSYLVFGLVCASMMCAAASREAAAPGAFKYGMQSLSIGCVVGSMYGIIRSGYLLARLADKPFLGGDNFVDVASNFALVGCIVLVLCGSAAPVWERMDQRIKAHSAVNDLRPMWRHLTQAMPTVVYGSPAPTHSPAARTIAAARDFWSWKNLDVRLNRRVTEICDAALHLGAYIPPDLPKQAQQAARELGLPQHTVPAYLLRTAIQRKAADEAPHPDSAISILSPGDNFLTTTRQLLPIGNAMSDSTAMRLLDRRLTAGARA
ncbi:MAB_1171c family putative transporter [Streptomyces griseoaurantiacus]|uniref:MAB_1171c family putative transporter n=1 Tax=Streptomyces griseoaurantiacus TaxID=68213 RepID=UPI0036A3B08C